MTLASELTKLLHIVGKQERTIALVVLREPDSLDARSRCIQARAKCRAWRVL
jgi:hypothetical protein